jgi:hypothetical protein
MQINNNNSPMQSLDIQRNSGIDLSKLLSSSNSQVKLDSVAPSNNPATDLTTLAHQKYGNIMTLVNTIA